MMTKNTLLYMLKDKLDTYGISVPVYIQQQTNQEPEKVVIQVRDYAYDPESPLVRGIIHFIVFTETVNGIIDIIREDEIKQEIREALPHIFPIEKVLNYRNKVYNFTGKVMNLSKINDWQSEILSTENSTVAYSEMRYNFVLSDSEYNH